MTNSNNSSGTSNPPQQQRFNWVGNVITGTNGGQWITVNIPYTNTIGTPVIELDLPIEADEKSDNSDGCTCKKCKTFYEYAEPNQEDGTLICWACRHGY